MTNLRIRHKPTGTVLADGPLGWGITPFEGNLYIRRKFLQTSGLKINFFPGFCVYKFLFVWMDLKIGDSVRVRNLAWMYWFPNPLLPFIWFRVALPRSHPEIEIEEYSA